MPNVELDIVAIRRSPFGIYSLIRLEARRQLKCAGRECSCSPGRLSNLKF